MSELRTGSKADRGRVVDPPGRTKQEIANGAEKPEALPVNPEGIPEALRQLPCWLPWRWYKPKKGANAGKWTKVPIDPRTGRFAKWSDPAVPVTFTDALAYHLANPDTTAGVGPVRSPVHPFQILDFDSALDPHTGELKPWAREQVDQFNTFTDISPTRTGFKLVVLGQWHGEGSKKPYHDGTIEVYGGKHYFTFTGHRIEGTPGEPQERQEQLDQLAREVFGLHEGNGKPSANGEGPPLHPADANLSEQLEILTLIAGWKNGQSTTDLFNGRWQGSFASQSEADASLVARLLFACGPDSAAQVEALFQQSALYRPPPLKGADYVKRTIAFVDPLQTERYRGKRRGKGEGGAGEGVPEPRPGAKVAFRVFGRLEDQGPEALLADKRLLAALVALEQSDPVSYQQALGEALAHGINREQIDRALAGNEPEARRGEQSPIEERPLTPIAEQSANGEATRPTANAEGEGEGSRGGGGPEPDQVAGQQLGEDQGEQLGEAPGPGQVPAIAGEGRGLQNGDKAWPYEVIDGCIQHHWETAKEKGTSPLCNFTAWIVEEFIVDDGVEQTRFVTLEGRLEDGSPLERIEVPAEGFTKLAWLVSKWGARVSISPGMGATDRLRHAIQMLSGKRPIHRRYQRLGWSKIGEEWLYLHAGGAIGAKGLTTTVAVDPGEALANYVLPDPPTGEVLRDAVRASLGLLTVGPTRVMYPLLIAPYGAVLTPPDFTHFIAGPSGAYKTSAAVLSLQHFGKDFRFDNRPPDWDSTANALEGILFQARDALMLIDEYKPSEADRGGMELARKGERIIRAQGNRSGRARCRPNASVKASRPPGGSLLVTGETVPQGHSLQARMLVSYLAWGEIKFDRLQATDRNGQAGLFAEALAGFIRWLAGDLPGFRKRFKGMRTHFHKRALAEVQGEQHPRAPNILAYYAAALHFLLAFAEEAGTIDAAERQELADDGWEALKEAVAAHAEETLTQKPGRFFVELIVSGLRSKRFYLGDEKGGPPDHPECWGWRQQEGRSLEHPSPCWQPGRQCIGNVVRGKCYLIPKAAYAAAQELAGEARRSITVSERVLWSHLYQEGFLAGWRSDRKKRRYTFQARIGETRPEVIWLNLRNGELPPDSSPDEDEEPCEDADSSGSPGGPQANGSPGEAK